MFLTGACGDAGTGSGDEGEGQSALADTCSDIVLPLPPPATGPVSVRNNDMTRDMVLTMARYFADPQATVQEEATSLRIPCQALPAEVRPSFVTASQGGGHGAAITALRRLLLADCAGEGCYAKYRDRRHQGCELPATVAGLAKWTGDYRSTWARTALVPSGVKGKPRIFYRDEVGALPGCRLVIAETLATDTDDGPSSPVRETEVIAARTDGTPTWDFFVYGAQGTLEKTSDFTSSRGMTVTGPAPFTCMGCHYDREGRAFQNRPLSFNPGD